MHLINADCNFDVSLHAKRADVALPTNYFSERISVLRFLTVANLSVAAIMGFHAPSAAAQAIEYNCDFQSFAQPDGIQLVDDFSFKFSLDALTEDAFMTGNNGVSRVFATKGTGGVTFLEPLSSGAVQSTTISYEGIAVHSRHTLIGADLVPSQYYGTCDTNQ